MEGNTLAGFAIIEKTKRDKIKELIQKECIRDAKAVTESAQEKVRAITENCFSIVENFLKSRVSLESSVVGGQIADNINEHTDEKINNAEKNLGQKIDDLKEIILPQNSAPAQTEKTTLKNDNASYIKTFSELLFLEDEEDDNAIRLKDMYISPSIKGKDIKASECVNKWYNTRNKPCLLLYGNAGVGKSSFVSKILADVNGITEESKREFKFDSSKVIAVALRNHTYKIDNKLTPTEILTTLFSCDSVDQLQDKLIILDGLDELSVLIPGFDGQSFLSKLSQLDYGFHVLVTSREADSYFRLPNDKAGLKTERMVWDKKQIKGWLKLYKAKKSNIAKWCFSFYKQFRTLGTNDKRSEIFCVPIILYICATSKTDLDNHSNIGSIYRDAFSNILLRKHIQGQHYTYELKEADKEACLIAWQYTKELSYQMFLHNTLDLVNEKESSDYKALGFRNAQTRTRIILKEKYKIENVNLDIKKELAVCPFTKENGIGGITFAHKTVYEYFTAVKLYEDYLVKFNTDYFDNNNEDTAAKEVFESFIEAFRYAPMSEEILNFLCEMHDGPFEKMIDYEESKGLNSSIIEQVFVHGMKNHIYTNISIKSAIQEYLYPYHYDIDGITYIGWSGKTISAQISTAFSNFTWFLTINGFTNKHEDDISKKTCASISNLLYGTLKGACFKQWDLDGVNFEGKYLSNLNFEKASLNNTNFKNTNMNRAILDGANMIGASFENANLTGADISDANLTEANFKNATLATATMSYSYFGFTDFENANLENAYSNGANYENANLYRANLNGAVLMFSDFKKSNLSYASLLNTNLAMTHFEHATLINANLTGADFTTANLEGADLKNAILYCSNLNAADLENADLTNADLEKSDLTDAYLVGANLTNANLKDAILSKAAYCLNCQNKTIFPDGFDPKEHGMMELDLDDINE